MSIGFRPFHRQQHRAAPFTADADALDEAQHDHDDGAPDTDLRVAGHQGNRKSRQAGQQ
jgi:hypothetical protein